MKNAVIISLKFAPGLKKEFIAIGENLRKKGINVRYLISENYSNIEGDAEGIEYFKTGNGMLSLIRDYFASLLIKKIIKKLKLFSPSLILFYNPYVLNPKIARLVKKEVPKAILTLYLHEPYTSDKSSYGFIKGLYIRVAEFIQEETIKYIDYVISPSEYSSELFKRKYTYFKGKNFIAPLLVPDQKVSSEKERRYFTISGNAHLATGHDTFIELVNYSAEKDLGYEFCLISSSNIAIFLKKLSEKGRKILKVINKPIIKDSEINEVMRESYAVFRLDKEVTQSGVIPVCYMNATPVIARDIPGLRQHVWDKETGVIIPFNSSPEYIVKAMEFVKCNFKELSQNARTKYEQIWAEWNFEKYYCGLIELIQRNNYLI